MNGDNETPYVILGKIGAPFGVKGLLTIHSFCQIPEDLFTHSSWFLKIKKQWKEYKLLSYQVHSKKFVVQLEHVHDRDQAALLTHCEIGIPRTALPEPSPGEYYWMDLIGLTVVNQEGKVLGTITELFETGANDVIVVQPPADSLQEASSSQQNAAPLEILIPYLPEQTVLKVDLKKGTMIVNWEQE